MKRSGKPTLFFFLFLFLLSALLPLQQAQAGTVITSVSLTITAPSSGAKPSYSASVPSGAQYTVASSYNQDDYKNGVRWEDITDDYSALKPGVDTFRSGHFYYVRILLSPKSGYQFSEIDTYNVKVNGKPAYWSTTYDGYFEISFDFPELRTPISSASLTITAPKAGAYPDYSPSVPSGANYYVDPYTIDELKNGVSWYDHTDDRFMVPGTDKFKTGHVYSVSIHLCPKDGYKFTESVVVKVNGQAGNSDSDTNWCYVDYAFPEISDSTPTVSSVSFSRSTATVGQNVTITAKTSTTVTKLSMYNGSTLAKSWTSGYTDSGDTRTWKVTYAFVAEGTKTLTFKGTDANGTVSAGKSASIMITAKPTISSVSFSKTKATVGQSVTITAKTPTTVTKLCMYNGSTLAKSWTGGYTDSGTTRTWKVSYAFVAEGAKTLTFKGTDANGVVSAGKTASITITAKPAVSSVSFSKSTAAVGESVTITAKTSTSVTKLSMYNGSTLAKSWTSGYTDSGTTRTWKVSYAFVAAGSKTLTFKGTDANGAVSAGKTATITITEK